MECHYVNELQHPLELKVNVLLDGIVRQLNPKIYIRNLNIHEESARKNKLNHQLLQLIPYQDDFAKKQLENRTVDNHLVQERYMSRLQWFMFKLMKICEVAKPYVRVMRVLVTIIAPIILFLMYLLHKSFRNKNM